jgi:hypothetical protein
MSIPHVSKSLTRSAAVETTTEGKPVRLKLRRVTSFCATSIAGFAKRSLDPDCSRRQRWPSVFRQRRRRRVRAPSRQDRVRTKSGSDAGLQMGQHRAWQHQGRHHRDLPRHQQQACPTLPRRIRIPLQPKIRSGRHDPRLTWAAVRTTPMPYRLLKLAEVCA